MTTYNKQQNKISLEELMQSENDGCVMVNRCYFYNLLVWAQHRNNIDKGIFEIFRKYIDIDNMKSFIYRSGVVSYYLMCVEDIKTLILQVKETPKFSTAFLKTEINKEEMHVHHEEIKRLYEEKKTKDNNLKKELKPNTESKK